MRMHRHAFTVAIRFISGILIFRDQVFYALGIFRYTRHPDASVSRHSIPGAGSVLDAHFVCPTDGSARAAVLICHGIGERVESWLPVQQLFAAHGVASLLFDYSGYGKSSGTPDWTQFENDAVAAFRYLEQLEPALPKSVVGFSLGSGIAAATINQLAAERLVLCAAFTSFRAAARAAGIPERLSFMVPPIWRAEESLPNCGLPVLVVHGAEDSLFPVSMASELAALCGGQATLVVVPGTGHNQPFRKPELSFWGPVISHVVQ